MRYEFFWNNHFINTEGTSFRCPYYVWCGNRSVFQHFVGMITIDDQFKRIGKNRIEQVFSNRSQVNMLNILVIHWFPKRKCKIWWRFKAYGMFIIAILITKTTNMLDRDRSELTLPWHQYRTYFGFVFQEIPRKKLIISY